MALFTGSVTGDWNKGATWGNAGDVAGVDFPSEAGTDTFAINTGVVVTIPASYQLAYCSGSYDGELIFYGKLKLSGNTTVNEDADGWTMKPGSILDVNGFDWIQDSGTASASTTPVTLLGTSGSRFTIMSSSTNGNIAYIGTLNRMFGDHNIQYGDISGCTSITLAYKQNTGQNITVKNVSFTGYDTLIMIAEGNYGANYNFDGIDLRNTVGATRRWDIGSFSEPDTGTRIFQNITMSEAGTFRNLGIKTITDNTTFRNIIAHNTTFVSAASGRGAVDGFFVSNVGATYQDIPVIDHRNGYFYSNLVNAHPFGPFPASGIAANFSNNVLECTGVDVLDGGDGVIFNSTFDGTMTIENNIFLWGSDGTAINNVGSTSTGVVQFKHNTCAVNNTAANSVIWNFPLLVKAQSAPWGGTLNCHSNIAYFANGVTAPTRAAGIALEAATADQIDITDNNVFWPTFDDRYLNVVITGKTEGVTVGFGVNDLGVDPTFVDDTRTIATWDSSLGGAGTAANAIAEMLKYNQTGFNANYTVANLIAYIQAGFAPTNIALKDAGYDSVTVGAVEYSSPIRILSDSVDVSDSLEQLQLLSHGLVDSIDINDLVSIEILTGAIIRILFDSVTATDGINRTLHLLRTLQSNPKVFDSIAVEILTTAIIRILSDSIVTADSLQQIQNLTHLLQDNMSVLDDLLQEVLSYRIVGSALDVSDSILTVIETVIVRILSDSMGVQDNVTIVKELTRGLLEAITIVDTLLRETNLVRLLQENVDISDDVIASMISIYVSRVLSDRLDVSDEIIQTLLRSEHITKIVMELALRNIVMNLKKV